MNGVALEFYVSNCHFQKHLLYELKQNTILKTYKISNFSLLEFLACCGHFIDANIWGKNLDGGII